MENQVKEARYVLVEGQKVYLNQEQQKAWNSFVNKARYQARLDGICRQPDYHLCCGDCLICQWRGEGKCVSLDDQHNGEGYGNERKNGYSPMEVVPSPEELLTNAESLATTIEKLYAYADSKFPNGSEILKRYINGDSFAEISRATATPESTIRLRVNRLLKLIRENKARFFDF